jgi:hypothetical protein
VTLILPLQPHPDTPCGPLSAVDVRVERLGGGRLHLRYRLHGKIRQIALDPRRGTPQTDELWQHTCFEAFLRAGDAEDYAEFNLAPSGRWAAYRFTAYRAGKETAREAAPPRFSFLKDPARFEFSAFLELGRLSLLAEQEPWRLGLSTVIEERNGRLSYWALAHPPGQPDFHHPACFTLELPAARQA